MRSVKKSLFSLRNSVNLQLKEKVVLICENKSENVCFVSSTMHSEINFLTNCWKVNSVLPPPPNNTPYLNFFLHFRLHPFSYHCNRVSFCTSFYDTKLKLNLISFWKKGNTFLRWNRIILFISKCQAWRKNDILKPVS